MKKIIYLASFVFLSFLSFSQTNYALSFNGGTDRAQMPNPFSSGAPSKFTVEWWLKPAVLSNYNQNISGLANSAWGAFVFHTTNVGEVYCGTSSSSRFTSTELPAKSVDVGDWQHWAFSYVSGTARIYKNGVLVASKFGMTAPQAFTGLYLGSSNQSISGLVDELRVWSIVRTPAEIAANINATIASGTTGLEANYTFDDQATTTATDVSGNNRTGTLTGCKYVLSNRNNGLGLKLNGTTDVVTINNPFNTSSPNTFTIEWWMNPTTVSKFAQSVSGGSGWNSFMFKPDSDGSIFVGTDEANCLNSAIGLAPATMDAAKWQHFAFTFDNGTGSFYKNGTQLATKTGMSIPANFSTLNFGSILKINGSVDEIKVWQTARTYKEVAADMYDKPAQGTPNLRGYWNFNDSKAGIASDSSGLSNDGVITGSKYSVYSQPTYSAHASTQWFKEAKYGMISHYIYNWNDITGNWNTLVNGFNVNDYADQCEQAGVGFVFFTLGQNTGYYCSPNATYDKYTGYSAGQRCSTRDLPMDLYTALNAKGIKLMFYLPSNIPASDAVAAAGLGGTVKVGFDFQFNDTIVARWSKVIKEWSLRYQDKVAGWWFDGAYVWGGYTNDYSKTLADAAKAGNDKSIVCFNPGPGSVTKNSEYEDFTGGEMNTLATVPTTRWLSGEQWHTMTFLGSQWACGGAIRKYAELTSWVKNVTDNQGVVTLDASIFKTGKINTAQLNQLKSLKSVIRNGMPIPTEPLDSNDNNIDAKYTGTWSYSTCRTDYFFNGDCHYSSTVGDSFEYTFMGTGVELVSEKSTSVGSVDIYIDDVFQRTVNCNSTSKVSPAIVYSVKNLPYGTHKLKGIMKTGPYLIVDRFNVYNNTTDIKSASLIDNGIELFPNPANDQFMVTSPTIIAAVRCVNLQGIDIPLHYMSTDEYSKTISGNNLVQGCYFIEVRNTNGTYKRFKLIKN